MRRIVEGLTPKELAEMGVDRATVEEKTGLREGLIPLSELDTEISRHRRLSLLRIEAVWGEEWEDKIILPKCPTETFLRDLAVFAEKNTLEWSEGFLREQIEARQSRPRVRKDSWVAYTSHDDIDRR